MKKYDLTYNDIKYSSYCSSTYRSYFLFPPELSRYNLLSRWNDDVDEDHDQYGDNVDNHYNDDDHYDDEMMMMMKKKITINTVIMMITMMMKIIMMIIMRFMHLDDTRHPHPKQTLEFYLLETDMINILIIAIIITTIIIITAIIIISPYLVQLKPLQPLELV